MPPVDQPEDVDIIVVLPPNWDFEAEIPPFAYNLLSRKRVRRLYGLHVFTAVSGSRQELEFIEYFQRLNPKWTEQFMLPATLKKGIVRVTP